MIKVFATFADNSGCGEYRVKFPAAAVNRADLDVRVEIGDHFEADAVFQNGRYIIRQVFLPAGVEVVSVQRPTHAAVAGALRWIKERRPDIGIVVEMDDDLLSVPPNNPAFENLHRRNNVLENTEWLRMSLACADVLTVSTPDLGRHYGVPTRPTFVVRNGVPAEMLSYPSRNIERKMRNGGAAQHGDRIIGWAGTIATHGGDLDVTCGALPSVMLGTSTPERAIRFRNVGPRDGVAQALGLAEEHVEASGWLSTDLYRVGLGELDIGVVPLSDHRFNRCKSALKAIEMGAVGVPVIASSLPEFEALQLSGMPIWLAGARRRHWSGALTRALLLTDGELREMAQSVREYVHRFATVEVRAAEWANAWKTAAQIARSRVQHGRRSDAVRSPTG